MSGSDPTSDTETAAEVIAFPKVKAAKADQRRFEARWGKSVADRGYTMLPAVLIRASAPAGAGARAFQRAPASRLSLVGAGQ